MWASRKILLLLVSIVFIAYGALYMGTLSVLHINGLDASDLIVGPERAGDSYQYVALAETMLSDGRFSMNSIAEPESFRTPGYPLFIAVLLALFKNLAVLPIVQIVLAALSCGLVFLIGERFFSRKVALAAAVLFAIEPAVLTNSFVAVSDTLFVFTLLCSLYVLTVRRNTLLNTLLGGVLMGVTTLIRPLGLYVLPLVLVWLLWEARAERRTLYRTGAAFLFGVAILIIPWMVRNYIVFNHFALSSVGSYNAYFYVREFEHQYTGKSKEELTVEMFSALGATTADRVESFQYADRNSQLALDGVLAHPILYTAFHLYSMLPFYFGSSIDTLERALYLRGILNGSPPPDVNMSVLLRTGDIRGFTQALTSNIPVLLERLAWLVLCLTAFGTMVAAVYNRRLNASVYVLFFALILAFGFMTGPVSYSRYRLPVEPLIFLLGCAGMASGIRTLLKHERH